MQNDTNYQQNEEILNRKRMMKTVNLILIIMICCIDAAHIPVAGNFDPFATNEKPAEIADESHQNVNLPSLDSIHDHVHQTNATILTLNDTHLAKVGPSLDLIDAHPHSHDKDHKSSIIENVKQSLIQPSMDFLDAQLHGGDEHVHDDKNQTDNEAADLNDFKHWLEEQNQTDQLSRFLLLQKEVNQFHFGDKKDLDDKLNRTIEELKTAQQRTKYDL